MPHFILEHSDNILKNSEALYQELFNQLHQVLVATEIFKLNSIKSRVIVHKNYRIADGNPQNAFIHLSLLILKGRPEEVKEKLADQLLEILKSSFSAILTEFKCSLTLEIKDLETYRKVSSIETSDQ